MNKYVFVKKSFLLILLVNAVACQASYFSRFSSSLPSIRPLWSSLCSNVQAHVPQLVVSHKVAAGCVAAGLVLGALLTRKCVRTRISSVFNACTGFLRKREPVPVNADAADVGSVIESVSFVEKAAPGINQIYVVCSDMSQHRARDYFIPLMTKLRPNLLITTRDEDVNLDSLPEDVAIIHFHSPATGSIALDAEPAARRFKEKTCPKAFVALTYGSNLANMQPIANQAVAKECFANNVFELFYTAGGGVIEPRDAELAQKHPGYQGLRNWLATL